METFMGPFISTHQQQKDRHLRNSIHSLAHLSLDNRSSSLERVYTMHPSISTALYMIMLFSILSSTTRAFTARAPSTPTTTFRRVAQHTRLFSSSSTGMPFDEDKMPFYALGTNLAVQIGGQANFKSLLEEDEMEICLQAFCDTLKGTSTADERTVLATYGPQLNKLLQERTSQMMDRVKKDGQEFLKNFLDCNEEASTTDSGLVYCPMKEGEGKQPGIQSTVEVHYHGTLTDGTVFDSSVDRGQTIKFPLSGVIQGWQEGLQMMKEGGKATLVIPSDLAYGEAGSGEAIPPGATLKFEVELFKVDA